MKKIRFIANITLIICSAFIVILVYTDLDYNFVLWICILSTVISFVMTSILSVKFIVHKIKDY